MSAGTLCVIWIVLMAVPMFVFGRLQRRTQGVSNRVFCIAMLYLLVMTMTGIIVVDQKRHQEELRDSEQNCEKTGGTKLMNGDEYFGCIWYGEAGFGVVRP